MTAVSSFCSELMQQQLPVKEIAARLGLTTPATFGIIKKIDPDYVKKVGVKIDQPFGMTIASARLRVRLGNLLYDLTETMEGDRLAVGRLTGLNRREQIRAIRRPYVHDWTISQIERLAEATESTLEELLNGTDKKI